MNKQPQGERIQLLDLKTDEIIAEGCLDVTITAVPDGHLDYKIMLVVDRQRPELDGKSWLLQIDNSDPVAVLLNMSGEPGDAGSRFEVFLADPNYRVWNRLRMLAR